MSKQYETDVNLNATAYADESNVGIGRYINTTDSPHKLINALKPMLTGLGVEGTAVATATDEYNAATMPQLKSHSHRGFWDGKPAGRVIVKSCSAINTHTSGIVNGYRSNFSTWEVGSTYRLSADTTNPAWMIAVPYGCNAARVEFVYRISQSATEGVAMTDGKVKFILRRYNEAASGGIGYTGTQFESDVVNVSSDSNPYATSRVIRGRATIHVLIPANLGYGFFHPFVQPTAQFLEPAIEISHPIIVGYNSDDRPDYL